MKKLILVAIFATIFITSPAEAESSVTIKPLDPVVGKLQATYEVSFNKTGATEYLFPPKVGFTSPDRKPQIYSVVEVNSKKRIMAKIVPLKKDGILVPGKYQVLVRFKEPHPKDTEYMLQYKIIVYRHNICYIDEDGIWNTLWDTGHKAKFIVPHGHTPVSASHPVVISEYYGRTHLLQDPLFIIGNKKKYLYRMLIFKTKPVPQRETKDQSQ